MKAKPIPHHRAGASRFRLATPRTALVLGGVVVLLLVAAVPLALLARQFTGGGIILLVPLMVPFAAVGLLVAVRQPANPIGWILLALALTLTIWVDAGFYSLAAYRADHHALPLARLAVVLASGWVVVILLLPLAILLFPDGRLPSQRWRWTVWLYFAISAVLVGAVGVADLAAFTDRTITIDSSGELASLNDASGGAALAVTNAAFVAWAVLCLVWIVGRFVDYRRSTGDRREQLKWLMSGGAACIGGFFLANVLSSSHSPALRVLSVVGVIGPVALPLAIGVGILKYRLYEIDRLISRTISYGILTGLLAGVFVGIVALATDVLPFSSPVGVAASTLAAAALFNPLRGRVQHLVDRRFNRARYDADAIVTAFTLRLRDAVDLETVRGELLRAVERAVEPSHASVWIRPPGPRLGG